MKSWISLISLFFILYGYAQQPTTIIEKLHEKARLSRSKNLDSAVFYSKQAYSLADKQTNIQIKARTVYLYSYYLIASNKFEEALDLIQFNIDHKEILSYEVLGNTYYNLGSIYYLKEQYDDAILHYLEAVYFFELAKDQRRIAKTQLQLSVIYYKLGNIKMQDYFADASLATLNKNTPNKQGDVPVTPLEKIMFLERQLTTNHVIKNDYLRCTILYSLGKAYFENNQFTESIIWFQKSIELKEKIGYSNLIPESKVFIADAYIRSQNPEKGLLQIINLPLNYKRKQPLKVENLLTEAYKDLGDYQKALFHNERLSKLQDSLNKIDENERIAEITVKYDTKQKEKQILALQAENQAVLNKLSQQQKQRLLWLLLALVLLFLSVYFAKAWKRSQKAHIEVEKEKEVIQKKVEAPYLLLKNKTKVYLEELQYVKSEGNYVEFHSPELKTLDRNKLQNILSKLPPNFIRVHRSYIVNKNKIKSFNSSSVFLKSGKEIPLSRTFKSNLL